VATPKLSKLSRELVDAFTDSAKHWGWVEDQGYGSMVKRALADFTEDKLALEKRIATLEKANAKLRLENKHLAKGYIDTKPMPGANL
jgi:hypothetical protein